jgi:hypothetical protein
MNWRFRKYLIIQMCFAQDNMITRIIGVIRPQNLKCKEYQQQKII